MVGMSLSKAKGVTTCTPRLGQLKHFDANQVSGSAKESFSGGSRNSRLSVPSAKKVGPSDEVEMRPTFQPGFRITAFDAGVVGFAK